MNNEHIKNILTLRYDPTTKPAIDYKTWEDFQPTELDNHGYRIEQKLSDHVIDEADHYDRIGISLSSGVDSMLLAKMIGELSPKSKLIAFHYCGINDETDEVIKFCSDNKIELKLIPQINLVESIPKMVNITNEPSWDAFNYVLFEEAKKNNCDVLVTGDGADEILGGYIFRYKDIYPELNPDERVWSYIQCHKRDYVEDQAQLFHKDMEFDWEHIKGLLLRWFDNPLANIGQIFLADYNGKLAHNFIPRDRKFECYFGIMKWCPYMHYDVADLCCRIGYDHKVCGDIGKIPLRKIAERYRIHPSTEKFGFSHDVIAEWKKLGTQGINSLMKGSNQIFQQKIINREWLQRHLITDSNDVRFVNKFLSLMTLEYWLMMQE